MSHVITAISHDDAQFDASAMAKIEKFITENLSQISSTKQLSPRAYDYTITVDDLEAAQQAVKDYSISKAFDLVLQPVSTRQTKKLFIFDMDSTLIYQEVIELIASYADIEDKVADITTRAMNGELDFNQSLAERVLLLKGIDATSIWEELKVKIQVTNGVPELCRALKKLGIILGVCSGGFIPLAEFLKGKLGLDYAFANTLGVDESNHLNGTTIGPIVNGEKKAELLLEIAEMHNIDPKDAVAVGDGANDLKMMATGGFGIAWNAKPKVQKLAPACLNTKSLLDVLYIMGYTDAEIKQLIE
ncbi:Phosphoserine phosphatase [Candida viswanathii]|uniref:phosphoserine phosphatase n=1 Tax=Candida viswanathii TaxID=5486 RepID=A0A367XQG4_9ASCO|nr:Phosphoserine phosphatase [Candida viswanathii]